MDLQQSFPGIIKGIGSQIPFSNPNLRVRSNNLVVHYNVIQYFPTGQFCKIYWILEPIKQKYLDEVKYLHIEYLIMDKFFLIFDSPTAFPFRYL